MESFFKKIRRRAAFMMFLIFLVGGGIGVFEGTRRIYAAKKTRESLSKSLDEVKKRYAEGKYAETVAAVSGLGDEKRPDAEIAKYGVEFPGPGGWETAVDLFSGREELRLLVDRSSQELIDGMVQQAPEQTFDWPNIELLGATYAGKDRIVTVMSVTGKTEIWLWKKKGATYETDSMVPGYDIRNVKAGKDIISFTLHPIEKIEVSKTYEFDTSPNKELEKYAVKDE